MGKTRSMGCVFTGSLARTERTNYADRVLPPNWSHPLPPTWTLGRAGLEVRNLSLGSYHYQAEQP